MSGVDSTKGKLRARRRKVVAISAALIAGAAMLVSPVAAFATTDDTVLTTDQAEIAAALGAGNLPLSEQGELADEWQHAVDTLTVEVDWASGESASESVTLSNGTVLEVGAEPVPTSSEANARAAGLSGSYRIWGGNGFIYMEYYVKYAKASSNAALTTVVGSPSGMVVRSYAGTTWDGKRFNVVRRTETSPNASGCCASIVQGITKVTYPGAVYQAEGGVDAYVKNGKLSTYLN